MPGRTPGTPSLEATWTPAVAHLVIRRSLFPPTDSSPLYTTVHSPCGLFMAQSDISTAHVRGAQPRRVVDLDGSSARNGASRRANHLALLGGVGSPGSLPAVLSGQTYVSRSSAAGSAFPARDAGRHDASSDVTAMSVTTVNQTEASRIETP